MEHKILKTMMESNWKKNKHKVNLVDKFVKKWIPELKERTNAEIAHAEKSRIGGYFSPVVDLSIRSKEMKSRVFEIRKSVRGRDVTKKVLAKHGSRKSVSNRKRKNEKDNQMTFLKTL